MKTPHILQVSEGINFSDENARAVVLLGIPFPAIKDAKVEQKKVFNSSAGNKHLGLVNGSEWYSLQAFRAMNQVRSPPCSMRSTPLVKMELSE